jgi:uncharacterized integral membrane protein (TIGR00698 family)
MMRVMEQAAQAVPQPAVATATGPRTFSEDWVAVALAVFVIALVLAGVRPALPRFAWSTPQELTGTVFAAGNLIAALQLGILVLVPATAGAILLGIRASGFVAGFSLLYALAFVAQAAAGSQFASRWGLEYVLTALIVGLILRQVATLPTWVIEAARTEYYIKTGLVVLGASILFNEMVNAGFLGVIQALIVVLSVWFFCFWLCKKLKVDDELSTMLSSAVSICGVSAAIATCGAIQGDRKKLSYVTSLVLIVAMPMMVIMPWIAKAMGLPDAVAGAWLGGTLDTSAAVVAAGEMVSDTARDAAVVVKLSQNAMIGVAAFLLTVWWAMRKDTADKPKASLSVIWERFPKFVIGFMLVSFVFSFVLSLGLVAETRGILNNVRTILFALAFISIGLETSLSGLVTTEEGRPAIAFIGGQAFNIAVTLVVSYLLFGGLTSIG